MNTSAAWFVTGTDTEIGKTYATCALLHAARRSGLRALAMKPVAAGAQWIDGRLVNEDALRLLAAGSFDPGLDTLNPYCLASPIAPHIAAQEEGVRIETEPIRAALNRLRAQADCVFVEGAGGFCVPLGPDYDFAMLARELALPVILVVGMRLGCINHALLTAEAVAARGLRLAGWIANLIDAQMLRIDENLATLRQRLPAPLLGVLPFDPDDNPAAASTALTLPEAV
ncbi:dethiobiotin synthase [Pseudothauera hydrothermalis]|uniref:dethiobiotin synthase n=1 Tax=Pseudothauera hydrothermalis TaxID=2184083 RepID=UPI000E08EDEE|nr:dethiobiotin synthase [Pseudothauera hydrothermalis]